LHDTHRAAVLGGEGLAVQRQVNDRRGAAAALEGLAATVVAQGRAAAAARFVAAAEQIRKELGAPLPPGDRADIARTLAEARKALGAVDFANVSASARLLPADDMVLEALTLATRMAGEAPPAQPETDRDGSIASPFGLTPRELGVLRLLVEGHSNPRIAAVLFISQRTVRNHVTSILAKLGVDSRTAAATFALRRGLV
jgi:DNA-binding NarL/FixJ family response regulator